MLGAVDIDHHLYFLAAPSGLPDKVQTLQQAFLKKTLESPNGKTLYRREAVIKPQVDNGSRLQRPKLSELDSITSRQFQHILDRRRGWFSRSRRTFRSCDSRFVNEILETCRRENKQVAILHDAGVFNLVRDIPRRQQSIARSQQKGLIIHLDLKFAGKHVIRLVLSHVDMAWNPDAGRQRKVKQAISSTCVCTG